MRAISLCIAVLLSLAVFAGCPEERKEFVEEVGGAPKREVDLVKQRVEQASETAANRLDETLKSIE